MTTYVGYAYLETPEGLLSSVDVCKEVGITYKQLEYWCRKGWIEGQPPKVGSGYRRLWPKEQVERAREIADAYDEANAALVRVGVTDKKMSPGRRPPEGSDALDATDVIPELDSDISTYATLTCGHSLVWDDPDEDVNGSHYCPKCSGYFRVESFR